MAETDKGFEVYSRRDSGRRPSGGRPARAAGGRPVTLKDIGLRAQDLDRACEITLRSPYPNPRTVEAKALRRLLQNASDGVRPAA